MPSVNLDDGEWQNLLFVLLKTQGLPLPADVSYPLAMKIARQLQDKPEHDAAGKFATGNSGGHPRKDEVEEKRQ